MEKIVLYGAGKIAESLSFYFNKSNTFEIAGYCVDPDFVNGDGFLGKPLVSSLEVVSKFPPQNFRMFVAMGYQELNALRAAKAAQAKKWGYRLVRYIGTDPSGIKDCGENSIIMDGAAVQPNSSIGSNTFIWTGALIGHHAVIGDNCWIPGGAAVGGGARIGSGCFIGINATIGNGVEIAEDCLIGASTLVTKNIPKETVVITRDTEVHRLNSRQFVRFSPGMKM